MCKIFFKTLKLTSSNSDVSDFNVNDSQSLFFFIRALRICAIKLSEITSTVPLSLTKNVSVSVFFLLKSVCT